MSAPQITTSLSDVVGSVLDSTTGVTATCALTLFDRNAAFIGTSKGNILFCTPCSESNQILEPACDVTLHCGSVYDVAFSSQHLVATAGHDAVSCVFPLHALFSEGGLNRCRRLTGHTVPVVAVRFLSDGTTLVSLGADGHVRVVDVVRGDVLAVLTTGFAAMCLTCSVDETVLFVGGRCLAAVDLYGAMRPTLLQSAAAVEAWSSVTANTSIGDNSNNKNNAVAGAAPQEGKTARMRYYQWAAPRFTNDNPSLNNCTADSTQVAQMWQTPCGMLISKLLVDEDSNTLTAIFRRDMPGEAKMQPCGEARWSADGGRIASQTTWSTLDEQSAGEQRQQQFLHGGAHQRKSPKTVSLRCRVKTAARSSAKQLQGHSSLSSANAAAALWHGRWYTSPFELAADAGVRRVAHDLSTTAAPAAAEMAGLSLDVVTGDGAALSAALLTRGEELALAEVRCDELQRECDALVFQLRVLRAAKEKKHPA